MNVVVNGDARDVHEGATVSDLLRDLGVTDARGVAVARNGDVVVRSQWEAVQLDNDDEVEVLHAVQGG
ncbi:MAG: sulfur carrier protein ThiS [Candidatus Dormibacteria bacterium]